MLIPNKNSQMIKILLIAAFGVILYVVLENLGYVLAGVRSFLYLLNPVLWGILIAFVANLPMRFLEEHVYDRIRKKEGKIARKLKRPVCMIVSYLVWVLLITGIVVVLLPEFIGGIQRLGTYLPSILRTAQSTVGQWIDGLELSEEIADAVSDFVQNLFTLIRDAMTLLLPWLINFTRNITDGVTGFFLGFILSFYILYRKERWITSFRKLLYAFLPGQKADRTVYILQMANDHFSDFAAGQVIESLIIGILCFIGMNIFQFDLAFLTSTTVAFFSLIPLFGTYVGAIPGAFILLMVDPAEAFWFAVFIIVLKCVEGYLIYPRVVGHQIGLSGMWVLFAVVIGGGIGGFVGCLISVPIFATVYSLLSEQIDKRIHDKLSNALIQEYPVK